MATVTTNNQYYTDIANAIRKKNGLTTQYKPASMAAAIAALSTVPASLTQKSGTTQEVSAATDSITVKTGLSKIRHLYLICSARPETGVEALAWSEGGPGLLVSSFSTSPLYSMGVEEAVTVTGGSFAFLPGAGESCSYEWYAWGDS